MRMNVEYIPSRSLFYPYQKQTSLVINHILIDHIIKNISILQTYSITNGYLW